MSLQGKCVVLGVTGGIAAYKSADLVSKLRKQGADVYVIMTEHATNFVAPLTFETLSNHPVVKDTFARPETWEVEHVALAKRADIFVIAPATANVIAKMSAGIADDMLTTTVLATKAPVLIAPAMNTGMWTAAATQENIARLKARGISFVGPDSGVLACGDTGAGRMSEVPEIIQSIDAILNPKTDFEGLRVLVTAGATKERMDPVRFLSNDSSGKMGFAIVEAAKARGASVTLVKGSTTAAVPVCDKTVRVESTMDLYETMVALTPDYDVIIQAAAPADFRFKEVRNQKIKKQDGDSLVIELVENPDIAAAVGRNKRDGQVLVGFAAETNNVLEHARKKLERKNLDLIVANDVSKVGAGFNIDTNIATMITRSEAVELSLRSKRAMADDILDMILKLRG